MDAVLVQGAQGEQQEFDMHDREVKPDPKANRVELVGLERRQNELLAQANLPPIEKRMSNREILARLREQAREAKRADA